MHNTALELAAAEHRRMVADDCCGRKDPDAEKEKAAKTVCSAPDTDPPTKFKEYEAEAYKQIMS